MIQIELNKVDADLFIQFQKYHDSFLKLLDSGALDVRGGSVTIHFDSDGNLRKIERNDVMFNS